MGRHGRDGDMRSSDDGAWLGRLDRIAKAVEVWRARAEEPIAPERGSSLAADSMTGLNVHSPVWYSMCVASEHLDFAIDAMRATSTMYPTAYLTVARTAFIAAVNAVWVVAPRSRQVRRERALRLRADDLRAQVTSFDGLRVPHGNPEDARAEFVGQLRERQQSLQGVATVLGLREDVAKMRLNQTKAIDWVAEHMHDAKDDLLIGATQSIWRTGSAAAHGQYHFGLMRFERSDPIAAEGNHSVARLYGHLDNDVGPALAAGAMTLSEAFRIYDLRRASHVGK